MQKEIVNIEFVQGVNVQFIDSLKNNGTKYLLIFDDSREEIYKAKTVVDFATAGRYRGLSITYIKHNLFYQSKTGREVELQNTLIVFFHISPLCDASQHAKCTVRSRIRASWFVSRLNVCTLRSFVDCLVSRSRWRITLLHKYWKRSLKVSFSWTPEAFKPFGRWIRKLSILFKCTNHFSTSAKVISFSVVQKSLSSFFANA